MSLFESATLIRSPIPPISGFDEDNNNDAIIRTTTALWRSELE
jgi:hypothetical protein